VPLNDFAGWLVALHVLGWTYSRIDYGRRIRGPPGEGKRKTSLRATLGKGGRGLGRLTLSRVENNHTVPISKTLENLGHGLLEVPSTQPFSTMVMSRQTAKNIPKAKPSDEIAWGSSRQRMAISGPSSPPVGQTTRTRSQDYSVTASADGPALGQRVG